MELVTVVKVGGSVTAVAGGTVGATFLYKHITGLYAIEQEAADSDTWVIGDATEVSNSNKKSWQVEVSLTKAAVADTNTPERKWICTVTGTTAESVTESDVEKSGIKKQIEDKVKKPDSGEDTNKTNRVNFVHSCSRNREPDSQNGIPNNDKVVSKIKLDLVKNANTGNKWKFDEKQLVV